MLQPRPLVDAPLEAPPRPRTRHLSIAPAPPPAAVGEPVPAVSVVIPLYNKRQSVARGIRSVLAQSFTDFELLVVDDGSSDGSAAVVEGFSDSRIRVLSQENQGVSVARNRGILEAKGELVAFLDADDEWQPNHLAVMAGILEERPEIQAAGAGYCVSDGESVQEALADLFPDATQEVVVDFFEAALSTQPLWSSSVVIRRSLFAQCGLFPAGISHGEDLDMWMRVGMACGKDGLLLTRRTRPVYHQDAENRAGFRRARTDRLPSAERVLSNPSGYDRPVLEFAYLLLLQQASRLRVCGQRWRSMRWIWDARRTRHHRRFALRELAHVLLDPRVLPS